uniref:Uncharacterized protein n=1 Tax=Hyaloperonospora arabidopsidis (strain Emoy2) TaxID=559515 RepID=M4BAT4_HYAAE
MNALRARVTKADVCLDRQLCYKFTKLKGKGQLRSLYLTQSAKPIAGQSSTVSTVQTVAGHSVLVSEPYISTPIGGKRVGMKADPQRDARKLQRRTGNLAEGVHQTPMSSQTQGIHATSPNTGIDLCDDATSEASPHGVTSFLLVEKTQEGAVVSVQAREYLVSEVTRLRESFVQVYTALDQPV